MLGSFGGPDRDDSVQDTSSPAVDETSENHPVRILSGCLKSCTENSPGGTKRDRLNTSILVTEPATNETANKSTNVVNGDLEPVSEAQAKVTS